VDLPLRPEHVPRLPVLPVPAEANSWTERSILEDIARVLGLPSEDASQWTGKQLSDLYREGICGAALLTRQAGEIATEMTVPLAHQSVLAGVMLTTQLIVASSPDLVASRPDATEGRFDVLIGLQQLAKRPRQRSAGCICGDADFLERHRTKWPS
jgi:hypothetical protein